MEGGLRACLTMSGVGAIKMGKKDLDELTTEVLELAPTDKTDVAKVFNQLSTDAVRSPEQQNKIFGKIHEKVRKGRKDQYTTFK